MIIRAILMVKTTMIMSITGIMIIPVIPTTITGTTTTGMTTTRTTITPTTIGKRGGAALSSPCS